MSPTRAAQSSDPVLWSVSVLLLSVLLVVGTVLLKICERRLELDFNVGVDVSITHKRGSALRCQEPGQRIG